MDAQKIDKGQMNLHFRPIDLVPFVTETASIFDAQAEERGIDFTFRHDGIDGLVLWADRSGLDKIIVNILSNAFKFSREGDSISVSVKQFTSQKHSRFEFTVADTGAGMSEEFLGRIFEPYSRETRFGAKKVMGTGLGMSIVRSIVTQMSGRITVKSTLGKGSVFTVSLPFEVVRAPRPPPWRNRSPCLPTETLRACVFFWPRTM